MKLCHAVFVYPRIELPYIKYWLDYHESQGIDHVYMTLHINEPRDEVLSFKEIVWLKKPTIPYVKKFTENELIKIFKKEIQDHINKKRISFNIITRFLDRSGTSHRDHQYQAYSWAQNEILNKKDKNYDWLLISDVDEFFVPENPNTTIKQIIANENRPEIASLRCWSVIHPSRYFSSNLEWNTYTKNCAIGMIHSKYASRCSLTKNFSIHLAHIQNAYKTECYPAFNIHHFRGFDKYNTRLKGWPLANRSYITKEDNELYSLIKYNPNNCPYYGSCY